MEEVIRTRIHALNEEVHQMLEQQEEQFWAKEAELMTVEEREGQKIERKTLIELHNYLQDLRANSS